jgi:hypothetical protein
MIAEARFKLASGEAALFELRMRMLAGTIPAKQAAANAYWRGFILHKG